MRRATLRRTAEFAGLGLFTEQPTRCAVRPAPPGEGVTIRRTDLAGAPATPATIASLCAAPAHPAFGSMPPRNTTLGTPEAPAHTTEHLLAALLGLGVTDARIELDGAEVPILDGSAVAICEALRAAGIEPLPEDIAPIVPRESVRLEEAGGVVTIEPVPPGRPAEFRYRLDYGPGAPIAPCDAAWNGDPDAFAAEIAPARTFSLEAEARQMQALGLFSAFTPRDLLVIGTDGAPIENEWRFTDEPARHKLLDLIGDLSLAGGPIHARVTSVAGGHALNHAAARWLARSGR